MSNGVHKKISNIEAILKTWPESIPSLVTYKDMTPSSLKHISMTCFDIIKNEFSSTENSLVAHEIETYLDQILAHINSYTSQGYFNQCVESTYNIYKILNAFGYINNRIEKIIRTSLNQRKQAAVAFHETLEINEKIKEIKSDVEDSQKSINEFYNQCFSDEDTSLEYLFEKIEEAYNSTHKEDGYLEKIQSAQKEAEDFNKEILEYKTALLDGDSDNESIKQQIHNLNQEMLANQKKMQSFISEYITGYTTTVKVKNTEETTTIKSKKELIDELHKSFQIHIDSEKSKIAGYLEEFNTYKKATEKEIEGLLKSATNASLASAFEKHKTDIEALKIRSERYFFLALIALIAAIFVPYIPYIDHWMFNSDNIYLNLLKKLLFTGPFIWLAYHQSKKSNQYFRLEQEYAHKAVVSRSFEGYKAQVLELYKENPESKEMLQKLLGESIDTIGKNPAEVLDSVKPTHHPIHDIKEHLSAVIDPLTKIIDSLKNR